MSSKLWVNYLIYGIFLVIIFWNLINMKAYEEPFGFIFLCAILLATFLAIPNETRLRQLLNTNRLAGLEKRLSQKKYEFLAIVIALLCCGILHMYYKASDIYSPSLLPIFTSIAGSGFGLWIRASMDKQEIKEIKEKQSLESSETNEEDT